MLSMNDPRLIFVDGLMWYLETRNWAFEKIKQCPVGSQTLDIRMFHYLYFLNLFGGVDLVRDYLRPLGEEVAFHDAVKRGFVGADYEYTRQLRNAVVHRGFDLAASGHADGTVVKALCSAKLFNQGGNTSYICTFQYTVELADHCNRVVNPAILEVLNRHGYLDPEQHLVSKEETMEAIRNAREMPDWAKAMAQKAVGEMDFDQIAIEIAATGVNQMKAFFGQ